MTAKTKLSAAKLQAATEAKRILDQLRAATDQHNNEQQAAELDCPEKREIIAAYLDHLDQMAAITAITLPDIWEQLDTGPQYDQKTLYAWIDELRPWDKIINDRVKVIIDQAGAAPRTMTDPVLCAIEDDYGNMTWHQKDAAFALGVLAGAKMAGYSKEQLERLAKFAASFIR